MKQIFSRIIGLGVLFTTATAGFELLTHSVSVADEATQGVTAAPEPTTPPASPDVSIPECFWQDIDPLDPEQAELRWVAPDTAGMRPEVELWAVGKPGLEYWIEATVGFGSLKTHWTQGPYHPAPHSSLAVTVDLPARALSHPLQRCLFSTLAVRLKVTNPKTGQLFMIVGVPTAVLRGDAQKWTLQLQGDVTSKRYRDQLVVDTPFCRKALGPHAYPEARHPEPGAILVGVGPGF